MRKISEQDSGVLVILRCHEDQDDLVRRINALGWNALIRLLFGYLCRDIDCGFKLFRREILDHVHIASDGAMIDTELDASSTRTR